MPHQLSTQQQERASGSPPTAFQSTRNQIQSLYLSPRGCPESLPTPHDFCLLSFWIHLPSVLVALQSLVPFLHPDPSVMSCRFPDSIALPAKARSPRVYCICPACILSCVCLSLLVHLNFLPFAGGARGGSLFSQYLIPGICKSIPQNPDDSETAAPSLFCVPPSTSFLFHADQ